MADIYQKGGREYHLVVDADADYTKCGVPTNADIQSATREHGAWTTCVLCTNSTEAALAPYIASRKKSLKGF